MNDPAVICEAKKLKIPCAAFITSWDNLTTKNRLMYSYDGFVLWSEQMKNDLRKIYPYQTDKPVYIVGAPQYDVFQKQEYHISKEQFCKENNLDPHKPIVLYALGSPNLFDEIPGAREFIKRAAKGEMGDIQIIVRPHPLKHNDPVLLDFPNIYPATRIQTSNPKPGETVYTHDKEQIIEWLNTIKYSDVVIQLASTMAIDAAILDRPIINIDFDPSGKQNQLVWELNHIMDHFAPITNANAMWEVHNYDEMVEAINSYLKDPGLNAEGRKKIAEFVCGYTDGNCGKRFAQSLLDLVSNQIVLN
jgi:CDP-glycerol glycerophosphotransferase (TagB/SpsB family)